MRSSLERPLVSLHNIELRAPVTTNLIAVTVVVAVGVPVVARRVLTWSLDEVEGSDAATVALAEVNIVVNRTTEEAGGVDLVGVHGGGFNEHGS